jgi:hypothetical protein
MDLHIYTRELLDKHLLPELKEIAQGLGIIPYGNKTRRETWVTALVGRPFPVFQSFDAQHQEPIENSPGVEVDPVREPLIEAIENSPGVDRVEESIELPDEKSLDVEIDRAQEPIDFPDLESALAEIARLRAQNDELLSRVRSQSTIISRAKDISPVQKPSLKRVRDMASQAFLDVVKDVRHGFYLTWGAAKKHFRHLKDIWELLIQDDWPLSDWFSPPPPAVQKPLFAPIHSRYSVIPFYDDDLIDAWSLGLRVNVASSGRSPPGGEAM